MTPDIALIKLARPVEMFNSTVRPICLASPGVLERPLCPDMSKDRGQHWSYQSVYRWNYFQCATIHSKVKTILFNPISLDSTFPFYIPFLWCGLPNTWEQNKKKGVWNISPDSTLLGVTDA